MEEKVSIIIPIYNVEQYLARCLDTVLAQTYENIEVICVNDGSTDNSSNILEHYAQFDSIIKIINKENGGLGSARNAGIRAAEGKYLLFLDSDDYIASFAVEHLVQNAEKNNVDFVICHYIWKNFNSDDIMVAAIREFKDYYRDKPFSCENMGSLSYKLIPVMAWTKLYRTDFIKENNLYFYEDMIYEDVPYWADVYVKAKRITYLPEPLFFYTIRSDSIMGMKGEKVFDIIKAYERVEESLKRAGYWDKFKTSVQALMMADFFHKFHLLKPELREEFFNRLKALKKDINYKIFEDNSYTPTERACAKRFELLNSVDYVTFCNTPFEVKYNDRT